MAVREVLLLGGVAGLALVVSRLWQEPEHRARFAKGLVLAISAHALMELALIVAARIAGSPLDNASIFFGYDNPRFLNHAQAAFIPVLGGLALRMSMARGWRLLARVVLPMEFALLYFSVGRSASLAIALATAAACAFGQAGQRWSMEMLRGAIAGGILYALLFHAGFSSSANVTDGLHAAANLAGDHSRLYLWRIALEDIGSAPLLGLGPMHFAHHPNRSGAHPHNFYLQVAAEFGLPFALPLFGALGRALLRRLGRLRLDAASTDPLALASVMACCAVAVDAFSSGNMVMPLSQLWIAIVAGIAMAREPLQYKAVAPAVGSRRWFERLLLLAYLAFAVNTTTTWLERRGLSAADSRPASAPEVAQILRPRFWLDGWF